METKINSGSPLIDWLLEGGYEKDVLTCIYGAPGTGKTNLLLMFMANIPKNKKIIYIDTEGNFSLSRFRQLSDNPEEIMKRIIFLKPLTFAEQKNAFEKLKKIVNEKVCAIIIDSIAMLYRLELGKNNDVYKVNRDLGIQLSYLTEIARKKKIPVIVSNQVYSDVENGGNRMVGGDILRYSSKCLIEIQKAKNIRRAVLRKHRSLPDNKEILFKITDSGIEEIKKEQD